MKRFVSIFVAYLFASFCFSMLLAIEASADRPKVIVKASNIKSSDGRKWEYVEEGIALGDKVYTDRDYVYKIVPKEFIGMPYMRTSNDSKTEGKDLEITFEIDKPAYVYIFWIWTAEPRAWLEDNFEKVMEKAVDVSWTPGYECDVWKSKEPFKNKVTLGYVGDSVGLYIGVVLELATTAVQSEGKLSATWGHLKQIH